MSDEIFFGMEFRKAHALGANDSWTFLRQARPWFVGMLWESRADVVVSHTSEKKTSVIRMRRAVFGEKKNDANVLKS